MLVTEAPPSADLGGAFRWEEFRRKGEPTFVSRSATIRPASCIRPAQAAVPRDACSPTKIIWSSAKSLTAWYPFWPGVRYLSILPTNHAIDFMVGFIGPFVCGACVVHLRTLRPEFVRDAFIRYRITYMALVPMVLKNLERGLQAKFEELSRRASASCLNRMIGINKSLTRRRPNVGLSRKLLAQVHQAFRRTTAGNVYRRRVHGTVDTAVFLRSGDSGGERIWPDRSRHVLTVNDFKPFRADTVGKPLPGVELRF